VDSSPNSSGLPADSARVTLQCPRCTLRICVSRHVLDRRARCKRCGHVFVLVSPQRPLDPALPGTPSAPSGSAATRPVPTAHTSGPRPVSLRPASSRPHVLSAPAGSDEPGAATQDDKPSYFFLPLAALLFVPFVVCADGWGSLLSSMRVPLLLGICALVGGLLLFLWVIAPDRVDWHRAAFVLVFTGVVGIGLLLLVQQIGMYVKSHPAVLWRSGPPQLRVLVFVAYIVGKAYRATENPGPHGASRPQRGESREHEGAVVAAPGRSTACPRSPRWPGFGRRSRSRTI